MPRKNVIQISDGVTESELQRILPRLKITVLAPPPDTRTERPVLVREEIAEVFEAITLELRKLSSPWLSTKQAAAYLGVDRSTICLWKNQGKLKAWGGPEMEHARYRRADLDALMEPK